MRAAVPTTIDTFFLIRGVEDHATVQAFHKAAVKAGGKSNGEPGIRSMYSPDYYAAFVFDPVGYGLSYRSKPTSC